MSCSHIYGSAIGHESYHVVIFRGFMLLKDLKKLKGREKSDA